MMDKAGLEGLAKELNPVIGYYDPLGLATAEFWGETEENTIGFLREAEIKHGRIAMFGFVGYIVHANGFHWPWPGPWTSIPTDISPQEMWDLTPVEAKWQMILTIGFFEFWRENSYVLESDGEKHYMRGGKPGYFPSFDTLPHPVPFNLYDPFKFSKNASPEKKAKGLVTEINNGRLAMIGLMGFLAESKVRAVEGFVNSCLRIRVDASGRRKEAQPVDHLKDVSWCARCLVRCRVWLAWASSRTPARSWRHSPPISPFSLRCDPVMIKDVMIKEGF